MKIATVPLRARSRAGATARIAGTGTRTAVARIVLENGPQSAAGLGERLGLSAAAVRRHLEALVADGLLIEREPARSALADRGRGRPPRSYAITDAGRTAFPHAYDDLATTALRYLRSSGGDRAVQAFAEHRASALQARLTAGRPEWSEPRGRKARMSLPVLAGALTAEGYPADVRGPGAAGAQLCQHHCPVAHVAAEFPQLCAAETTMFERLLGTYVQRLATIAHGDGVCTTHVPRPPNPQRSTPSDTDSSSTERTS